MESDPLVASNYAQALFNVAKKQDVPLEKIQEEARTLHQLILGEEKLCTFLNGPQFREETKEAFIGKVFKDKLSVILFQFIILLIQRDRIEHLVDILQALDVIIEAELGFTLGTVITAVELSSDEQAKFKEKLEVFCDLKFDLTYKTDSRIIGGVKVKYNDILMDSTIETHLQILRESLAQTRLAS